MRHTIQLLTILGLIVLSQAACKKDCEDSTNPECSNYNPCYEQTPLTGEFTMDETLGYGFSHDPYENIYPDISAPVKDTIMPSNTIVFTASDDADRYEWTIGSDPRTFTDRTVRLSFFDAVPNLTPTTLAVRLRTYRDNPQSCYPSDTVSESTDFITVAPRRYTALRGEYKGVSSIAPNDSFVVKIYQRPGDLDSHLIDGIIPGCDFTSLGNRGYGIITAHQKGIFEREIVTTNRPACYSIQGIIEVADNQEDIQIQYYLKENALGDEIYDEFVFTGTKIN